MKFDTKLTFFFKNFYKQGKKKLNFFQIHFTNSIFFLLFGFLVGNLFGSLLNIFQESILWHGFITIIIIFLVEMSNYLIYKRSSTPRMTLREDGANFYEKNVGSHNKVGRFGEPRFYTRCKDGKVTLHRFRKEKIQLFQFTFLEKNLLKDIFYYQHRDFKFPFIQNKKKKFLCIDTQRLHRKSQSQKKRNFFRFLGFKSKRSSFVSAQVDPLMAPLGASEVAQKEPRNLMRPKREKSTIFLAKVGRPLEGHEGSVRPPPCPPLGGLGKNRRFFLPRSVDWGKKNRRFLTQEVVPTFFGVSSLRRLLFSPLTSLDKKQNFFKKRKNLMDTVTKSLNLFKIGILLGFFIDAFKVGS